jgi:hypothetical protein
MTDMWGILGKSQYSMKLTASLFLMCFCAILMCFMGFKALNGAIWGECENGFWAAGRRQISCKNYSDSVIVGSNPATLARRLPTPCWSQQKWTHTTVSFFIASLLACQPCLRAAGYLTFQ